VIVQERIRQCPAGWDGFQTQQMHGAGVYIAGIPLVENAPVGEGFARHVWNPGVIAQLDQRRTGRGGGKG
jgi:hypothetical protein